MNDSSVLLEGGPQGARVKLDLQHIPAFTLFPGQVRRLSTTCLPA
jgi:hypothetical protein